MAKHASCFPICTIMLALVCLSISALADSVDLVSAQPEFATSSSVFGLNGNTELFPLSLPENWLSAGWGADMNPTEISWLDRYKGGDYPDFGKSRGSGDFYGRKHPSSVPEPSSLTLLGTAALAIAFGFRKRFQR